MYLYELSAVVVYFLLLLTIGFISYRKLQNASDFILGSRSMNYWLTALAAHASDMSSWLFMGYPALIFSQGLFGLWTAIGLITCMFLNWQFIAPKIRVATEQYNSLTFSSFFESRLADTSGIIRILSALILIIFYTVYISAGLTGLGDLLEILFSVKYGIGILVGIFIVIPYVFSGGYLTLAWIDLFQGLFLLGVIIAVPLWMLPHVGGWGGMETDFISLKRATSLIPDWKGATLLAILSQALGWGLGYFGQPHIVTKFMGIRNVNEISKSKWIGISWMILSLGAATLVGAVGLAFFKGNLGQPELVFIEMVRQSFHPVIVGFVLCAVLAATINAMSSQVLVLSSSLAEDFYKNLLRKNASSKELLLVSRLGVVIAAAVAFSIAFHKTNTIYSLVQYAWSGIGSSLGPLVILSLYSRRINKYGAYAGIGIGGLVAGFWPLTDKILQTGISSMLPGFIASMCAIVLISHWTRHKTNLLVQ